MTIIVKSKALILVLLIALASAGSPLSTIAAESVVQRQLLFTSQGKTGIINSDGSGLKYFEFSVPNQATWQPGPLFLDGKRIVFLSMEPRRDGPGKPFEEFYTQTPTRIWAHDLVSGSLAELCTKDRIAQFETPALLIGDDRLLVQVVKNKVGQIVSMKLDGTDSRDFTTPGEGLPYGLSLCHEGKRVAFHLASPQGYQVWTSDLKGENRVLIKGEQGHIFFGTSWSPDDQWILYVDCIPGSDPGHDWCDVCIGKADGSEHRTLSNGMAMWFAATYGPPNAKGSGSNLPAWSADGKILFPQRIPESKVPWEYRVGKQDLDHFNRDYKPQTSRGGVSISRLDSTTGQITELTPARSATWDFRVSESSDGKEVAFCRAETGGSPALWVMDSDGKNPRQITKGIDGKGVDHPRWLPVRK